MVPFSLSPSLSLPLSLYGMASTLSIAWSLLQLGGLVLDDTGGDSRPSEEPFDTS